MKNRDSLADEFLALDPDRRRSVHFRLCEYALKKWQDYMEYLGRVEYVETVAGSRQVVDARLPLDALEAAARRTDFKSIKTRYREPITALQDDDLPLPENITCAFYAIYNLFRKYALKESVDDWLIVNQALSSEDDSDVCDVLLVDAIQIANR